MTPHSPRFTRLSPVRWPTRPRNGMALLELLCAAAVLSATMLVLVPLLARVGQVRAQLRAREAVVRELGNIVEQARAEGRPSLAEFETVGTRVVGERLAPALDDVRFTARPEEEPGQDAPGGKLEQQQRVVLAITWTGEKGISQSVELACWIPSREATTAGEVP